MAEPDAPRVRRVVCYANLDGHNPRCSYRGLTRDTDTGRLLISAETSAPVWVRLDFSNVLEDGEGIAHVTFNHAGMLANYGQARQDVTFAVSPAHCGQDLTVHMRMTTGDSFTDRFRIAQNNRFNEDATSPPLQPRGHVA
jgi:hypothetical protein